MSDAAVIELNHVFKSYGRRLALGGVSLRIEPGVTGLLGPNGSGKSTLIKSLMGLVHTEAGEGQVLGHPWPKAARAIRDLVGYLPEDDCYIAGLQGVESVQLGGRLSGLPRLEALRRAHEVMDFCDIGQERYRQVETYSTGMRQKLKFAQALVHDPPLIILDEPTTGLDPGQREALLNRIGVLAKKFGKTILLSTHILPDVRQVCDSVVILVAGRVRISASLESMSRPATPELSVWVDEGVERLETRVQAAGMATTLRPPCELRIGGLEPEDAPCVWRWADEVGASIRRLEPARASLEQTFVEAVREAAAAGDLELAVPNGIEEPSAVEDLSLRERSMVSENSSGLEVSPRPQDAGGPGGSHPSTSSDLPDRSDRSDHSGSSKGSPLGDANQSSIAEVFRADH